MNLFGWLQRNKQGGASAPGRGKPGAVPFKKSEAEAMLSLVNPLAGMTERGLQNVFDTARRGCYARLQWVYGEIEAADPTLLTVAERRESAAGDCDFRITSPDGRRADGFDGALAAEQRAALEYAYGRVERSLPALSEHLCGARFRGFAHARPVFDGPRLAGFEHLDQWNFCRDTLTGRWWWNPSASDGAPDAVEVPPGELVSLAAKRHIDYPALAIYIRLTLGERKYGVWLERYGIPPVTIIMPEFADTTDQDKYFEAADRMSRAGGGALPYGSEVNYANEARGANPFDVFLRHQQELIVTMATGGTLGTLASPTGIGGGASDAQENVWRSISRRDVRAAGDAIDASLTARILAPLFPGRPVLARFEFATEERPTAAAVFEEAAKARAAGYTVDMAELQEETGWKLEVYEAAPAAPGAPIQTPAAADDPAAAAAAAADVAGTAMNGAQVTALLDIITKVGTGDIDRAVAPAVIKAAFPLLTDEQVASMIPPPGASRAATALNKAGAAPAADPAAAALADDLRPLADRLAAALELPDAEMLSELEAIRRDAPGLFRQMDESGLFTSALEDKLARAFAAGFREEAK